MATSDQNSATAPRDAKKRKGAEAAAPKPPKNLLESNGRKWDVVGEIFVNIVHPDERHHTADPIINFPQRTSQIKSHLIIVLPVILQIHGQILFQQLMCNY